MTNTQNRPRSLLMAYNIPDCVSRYTVSLPLSLLFLYKEKKRLVTAHGECNIATAQILLQNTI